MVTEFKRNSQYSLSVVLLRTNKELKNSALTSTMMMMTRLKNDVSRFACLSRIFYPVTAYIITLTSVCGTFFEQKK